MKWIFFEDFWKKWANIQGEFPNRFHRTLFYFLVFPISHEAYFSLIFRIHASFLVWFGCFRRPLGWESFGSTTVCVIRLWLLIRICVYWNINIGPKMALALVKTTQSTKFGFFSTICLWFIKQWFIFSFNF